MADITGTSKNDKRTGTADRDNFYGMGGNDDFDGKGGTDTARYNGRFSEFDIKTKGNEVEVKDKEKKGVGGDEGNDKLKDVERLEFADKLVVLKDAAPVGADITKSTNEDEAVKIYVREFASDADGDGLVLSNLKATNGTVTQGSDGQGAFITYTPNTDYNGPAQVTYTVTEKFAKPAVDIKGKAYGAKSDTGKITIDVKPVDDVPPPPVNAPPIAVDDKATTPEDTATVIDVLANDTDANVGDTLSIVPGSVSVTAGQGTAEIFEGKIRFTPGQDYNGTAEIVYKVTDGKAEDEGRVSVEVTPVDDTPVNVPPIANPDSASTPEDTAITIDVLANDVDLDGPQSKSIVADSVAITEGQGEATIVEGGIRFTPALDFNGNVVITYAVTDGVAQSTSQVNITVTPVDDTPPNRPPVAVNDTTTTPEDTAVTFDVVGNDTDPDGDALTVTAATLADGAPGTVEIVNNQVRFTPAANSTTGVVINYTVEDPDGAAASAQLEVNVTPVNDGSEGPVLITGSQDGVVVGETLTADISQLEDPDGAPTNITYVWETIGLTGDRVEEQSGADATYLVEADDVGRTVRLTVNYTDGQGFEESTQSMPTTPVLPPVPVNTPPVAVSDTATTDEDVPVTIPVLANDLNPDDDDLTVTATLAEGGTVAGTVAVIDHEVVFTPAENDFGEATINYTISDGTFDSSSTVAVTVTPVNDAPIVANPIPDTSAQEGAAFSFALGEDTFADVDAGDTLTYSAALDDGSALPSWLSFDPDTLTFAGTPDDNAQGTLAVEVTATDSAGAEASDTFNIVVADTPEPTLNTYTRSVIGTILDRVNPALQDTVTRTNAAIVREDAEGPSNPDADSYGILEFNVGSATNAVSAVLRLDPNSQGAGFPNQLNVYAYGGDGAVTVSDKDLGVFVGDVTIDLAMTQGDNYVSIELDTGIINDLLEEPGVWLGFRLEVVDEAGANSLFFENSSGLQSQLDLALV